MVGKYELVCTEFGCKGHRVVDMHMSAGWKIGKVVKSDPANPNEYQCPLCKRQKMKVSKVPTIDGTRPPKGFAKLPKE